MKNRYLAIAAAALALLFAGGAPAYALNPQPEVPSKPAPNQRTNPKALNPQPEVPSKGSAHGVANTKALNPQPEVPSKPKKTKKAKHKNVK